MLCIDIIHPQFCSRWCMKLNRLFIRQPCTWGEVPWSKLTFEAKRYYPTEFLHRFRWVRLPQYLWQRLWCSHSAYVSSEHKKVNFNNQFYWTGFIWMPFIPFPHPTPPSCPRLVSNDEELFNLYYIFVPLSYFWDVRGWQHMTMEWSTLEGYKV